MKEYTFTHPAFKPAKGKTHKLIDELIKLGRSGENQGGDELISILSLLSDEKNLPFIFKNYEGSANRQLARELVSFLGEFPKEFPEVFIRIAERRNWQELPVHAVGVGSASGAIYALLCAAGAEGGEVITTSFNYTGVVNAILLARATPKFVDVDEKTWEMDVKSLKSAITKKTKAVILVHLNRVVDIEPFFEILEESGLNIPLIQDASLAMGSTFEGLKPGLLNVGEKGATVFSLTLSKVFSGLGGAIVTANDAELIEKIFKICNQGFGVNEADPISVLGANFKLNNINSAIALMQLRQRKKIFKERALIGKWYEKYLSPLVKNKSVRLQDMGDETMITHLGVILSKNSSEVARKMYEDHRIQLALWHVHHMLEFYKSKFEKQKLPVSEKMNGRLAFLPFHTNLTEKDVAFICKSLAKYV